MVLISTILVILSVIFPYLLLEEAEVFSKSGIRSVTFFDKLYKKMDRDSFKLYLHNLPVSGHRSKSGSKYPVSLGDISGSFNRTGDI